MILKLEPQTLANEFSQLGIHPASEAIFLHKSEKYAKLWKFGFLFCVKMYILSIKIRKEHEVGIAYLCNVGKWIP